MYFALKIKFVNLVFFLYKKNNLQCKDVLLFLFIFLTFDVMNVTKFIDSYTYKIAFGETYKSHYFCFGTFCVVARCY